MDAAALRDPVFIAKVIDFVIFVTALTFAWNKWGAATLAAQQEAQNKAVADAERYHAESKEALAAAQAALDQAHSDAKRMVEFGSQQGERLVVQERAAASEEAQRIIAHAGGELERERYRVRRELLEDTVDRAHAQAREIVLAELDAARQRALVEQAMEGLERAHA